MGPRSGPPRAVLAEVLAGAPSEPAGLVARYALGTDYHASLRDRLAALWRPRCAEPGWG